MRNAYHAPNKGAVRHDLATPANLTEEQRKMMISDLDERHKGVRNRRRLLVAEGGLEYTPISNTYTDMEFAELKRMSRTDICAVYGVPPSVCGFYEDSNYAHTSAAEESFWMRTMLPHAAWLAEEFETAIVSRFEGDRSLGMSQAVKRAMTPRDRMGRSFGRAAKSSTRRTLYAWFDSSSVPAVQAAMASQADAAAKWVGLGVPLADFMDAHDIGYERRPWQKTWYKSLGMVDVQEDAMSLQDDPSGPTDVDLDNDGQQSVGSSSGRSTPLPVTRDLNEKTKAAIWLAQRRSYAALENKFRSKTRGHFNELRNQTLQNLERVAPKLEGVNKNVAQRANVIAEILFDIFKADNQLVVRVGPLIREASCLGGNQAMQEAADATGVEQANPFAIADPVVQDKIRQRTQNIAGVNHKLRSRLSASRAEGIGQNETSTQLAERIRKHFNMASSRARTIAMTETGAAVEESRQEGRRQAGTPMKSWLWSRKETGRHWHFDTETNTQNTPVANESKFIIADTGNEAMAPRLSGAAKDDINCGCTTLARYPGDSIKSVMDRYTTRGFLSYEQLCSRDAQSSQTQDIKS